MAVTTAKIGDRRREGPFANQKKEDKSLAVGGRGRAKNIKGKKSCISCRTVHEWNRERKA